MAFPNIPKAIKSYSPGAYLLYRRNLYRLQSLLPYYIVDGFYKISQKDPFASKSAAVKFVSTTIFSLFPPPPAPLGLAADIIFKAFRRNRTAEQEKALLLNKDKIEPSIKIGTTFINKYNDTDTYTFDSPVKIRASQSHTIVTNVPSRNYGNNRGSIKEYSQTQDTSLTLHTSMLSKSSFMAFLEFFHKNPFVRVVDDTLNNTHGIQTVAINGYTINNSIVRETATDSQEKDYRSIVISCQADYPIINFYDTTVKVIENQQPVSSTQPFFGFY